MRQGVLKLLTSIVKRSKESGKRLIEQGHNASTIQEEKRNYFRVDDVISVVANPISEGKDEEISKVLPISGMLNLPTMDVPDNLPDNLNNQKLSNMIMEIKIKLDFIINHFLLEKEGLLSAEKKTVNISASGIRFTVNHPVNVKDIMEIKMLLPTSPPVAVLAYGEVKRVKSLDDGTYEIALQYLNMGDKAKDEIIQYTLTHQRETIRTRKDISKDE